MFYCPDIGRFLSRDLVPRPGKNPYFLCSDDPIKSLDPLGADDFTYPDPDRANKLGPGLTPIPNASIATISIILTAKNLCSLTASISVDVSIDWHSGARGPQPKGVIPNPRAATPVERDANYLALIQTQGEVEIDGVIVPFTSSDGKGKDAHAIKTFKLPNCPSLPQSGSGLIKIIDKRRKGTIIGGRPITGVSQIYKYSWSYECESRVTEISECCAVKTAFSYKVEKLDEHHGQIPNL